MPRIFRLKLLCFYHFHLPLVCTMYTLSNVINSPSTMQASSTEHPSPPRTVPLSATADGGSEILSLLINY